MAILSLSILRTDNSTAIDNRRKSDLDDMLYDEEFPRTICIASTTTARFKLLCGSASIDDNVSVQIWIEVSFGWRNRLAFTLTIAVYEHRIDTVWALHCLSIWAWAWAQHSSIIQFSWASSSSSHKSIALQILFNIFKFLRLSWMLLFTEIKVSCWQSCKASTSGYLMCSSVSRFFRRLYRKALSRWKTRWTGDQHKWLPSEDVGKLKDKRYRRYYLWTQWRDER